MKKRLFAFLSAGILCSAFVCAEVAKPVDRKECVYVADYKTPENSVVFFGYIEDDEYVSYSQVNPSLAPDNQLLGEYIVSRPVECGSTYRLMAVAGKNDDKQWSKIYDLDYTKFDITVPETPGLYYIGSYVGITSYEKGEFSSEGSFYKVQKIDELKCLKNMLKLYKKTSWEGVIKARIQEIKDQQAAEKAAEKQAKLEAQAELKAKKEAEKAAKAEEMAKIKAEKEAAKQAALEAEQNAAALESSQASETEQNPAENQGE